MNDLQLPPAEVKERYPASSEVQKIVNNRNEEICNIIMGKQRKMLLIIGPCQPLYKKVCSYCAASIEFIIIEILPLVGFFMDNICQIIIMMIYNC